MTLEGDDVHEVVVGHLHLRIPKQKNKSERSTDKNILSAFCQFWNPEGDLSEPVGQLTSQLVGEAVSESVCHGEMT